MRVEKELVFKNEAYQIIGAAMAVDNELGSGMREVVYGDALEIEFKLRGIPFQREQTFNVLYKGVELQHKFKCDFICYKNIIVELKAEKAITDIPLLFYYLCAIIGSVLKPSCKSILLST